MKQVVDASVALKWVLDEPGKEAADVLLDGDLLAPSLWLIEAANTLWKRSQRGELRAGEAAAMLAELRNAPVTTVPMETDVAAALDIAARLGHPVYNCLYLALALREGAEVVTADRRFVAAAGKDPELAGRVRLL